MSDVPPGVLVNILSRLPVKSLLRFRSLSKTECALIDSPYFINLHKKQTMKTDKILVSARSTHSSTSFRSLYLTSPPTIVQLETPFDTTRFRHVLGTCNGLVCLSNMPFDRSILLWNPSTRKHKVITAPMDFTSGYSVPLAFDQIGYDHITEDYKVVRFIQSRAGVWFNSKVFVYSLKLDTWQSLEQRFPYDVPCAWCHGQGVCVSGALHWLVSKNHPNPYLNKDHLLVSFELASQSFQPVPHPECFDSHVITSLGVLGGCLRVVAYHELFNVDVWVMGEYGVKESWSKLVALTSKNTLRSVFPSVRPVTYSNNRKEVLLEIDQQWFEIYDLEEQKSIQVILFGDAYHFSTYVYQESLVMI